MRLIHTWCQTQMCQFKQFEGDCFLLLATNFAFELPFSTIDLIELGSLITVPAATTATT